MPKRILPSLAKRISTHIQTWEHAKKVPLPCPPATCPFVTVSREFGCQGAVLGYRLVEILNERYRPEVPWVAYDRELLDRVASEMNLRREIIEKLDERRRGEMRELFDSMIHKQVEDVVLFRKMAEIVRTLAYRGKVVLVGRGCYLITQDLTHGLHIRLVAPHAWRVGRYARDHNLSFEQAEKKIVEGERQRQKFLRTFFVQDPSRASYFHMILDNSRFELDQLAEVILGALGARFGEPALTR